LGMAQSYRGCSIFNVVEQEFRRISTGSPQPLLRADSVRATIEARGYDDQPHRANRRMASTSVAVLD